jgi:hypothetical protein
MTESADFTAEEWDAVLRLSLVPHSGSPRPVQVLRPTVRRVAAAISGSTALDEKRPLPPPPGAGWPRPEPGSR